MMDGGSLTLSWRLETLDAARVATSLRLVTDSGTRLVDDPAAIDRLLAICSGRRWKSWDTTMPGFSPRQEIILLDGDQTLKHFSLWGCALWTSDGLSKPRFTPLGAEDRQWVECLFFPVSMNAGCPEDGITP
ncbi:hypothetical protein CA12_39910 [Alienimonas californiensis]|uniref:Uncharacterized protein n=2 Tax=Alienimonas californiensis TaxID=2527989 RepID=A0A517PER2_9PLAN|nr:hypothetical protein CA12_39910 [Alienimonas californiensis]